MRALRLLNEPFKISHQPEMKTIISPFKLIQHPACFNYLPTPQSFPNLNYLSIDIKFTISF